MNKKQKDSKPPQPVMASAQPPAGFQAPPPVKGPARRKRGQLIWVLAAVLVLGFSLLTGGIGGYVAGAQARQAWQSNEGVRSLREQFDLGVQDLAEGRYEVARQRFEYVLKQDPAFPGAVDLLAQAMQVLYATATPTPLPATATPTPTRDPRPSQELFALAQNQHAAQDWSGLIDTLSTLRKEDKDYQTARVDAMLYIALRNRGVKKILEESNLEGGIYELSLAENFGPLDVDASGARNVARLYIIGSSFWEAIPEQAVYYFQQVAAAAPYLRDASGWTATDRYRGALIQYGNQLGQQGNWCEAQVQFELALAIREDEPLRAAAENAALQCNPPTPTPLPESETPTPTATLEIGITPTATFPGVETPTPSPTVDVLPTTSVPPTSEVTPTLQPTTETPPTQEPTTEVPPPTDTPTPDGLVTKEVPPAGLVETPEPTTSVPGPANLLYAALQSWLRWWSR